MPICGGFYSRHNCDSRAGGYGWITTGVPGRSRGLSAWRAAADTRSQPAEAGVPSDAGSFVPWIAS